MPNINIEQMQVIQAIGKQVSVEDELFGANSNAEINSPTGVREVDFYNHLDDCLHRLRVFDDAHYGLRGAAI